MKRSRLDHSKSRHLSRFQIPFKIRIIWKPTYFQPFENLTCPVFVSPLYSGLHCMYSIFSRSKWCYVTTTRRSHWTPCRRWTGNGNSKNFQERTRQTATRYHPSMTCIFPWFTSRMISILTELKDRSFCKEKRGEPRHEGSRIKLLLYMLSYLTVARAKCIFTERLCLWRICCSN